MKLITPFLLLVAAALTACETPQNRRTLYSPAKASGPYTDALRTGSWKRGEYPAPKVQQKKVEEIVPPTDLVESVAPAI